MPISSHWPKALALLAFGVGSLLILYGLYAVFVMAYVVLVDRYVERINEMLAGCILYLGTGFALFNAGIFFWHNKMGPAWMSCVVALFIPVLLFSTYGF